MRKPLTVKECCQADIRRLPFRLFYRDSPCASALALPCTTLSLSGLPSLSTELLTIRDNRRTLIFFNVSKNIVLSPHPESNRELILRRNAICPVNLCGGRKSFYKSAFPAFNEPVDTFKVVQKCLVGEAECTYKVLLP